MANNFRISYTDVDSSFAIKNTDTPVKGYMVVKSPKGTTKPTYFPAGSASQLIALVGAPSATYPLIQDAIDFNNQFGLFVSSPPGSSNAYASYYGGLYVTEYGVYQFDRVTDASAPNYKVLLPFLYTKPAGTGVYTGQCLTIGFASNSAITKGTTKITISNVDASFFTKAVGFRVTYTGVDPTAGSSLQGTVIDFGFSGNLASGTVNILSTGKQPTAFVGNSSVGTYTTTGQVTSIDINSAGGSYPLPSFNWGTGGDAAAVAYWGTNWDAGGIKFEWLFDVTNDTYVYFNQRSPQEIATSVTLNKIGYINNFTVTAASSTIASVAHGFVANDAVRFSSSGTLPTGITSGVTYYVTTGPATNSFTVSSFKGGTPITFSDTGSGTHSVQYENFAANLINLTFAEETLPGKISSGGSYTGSLLPSSVDGYGVNNFIENVMSSSLNLFIQVNQIKPFTSQVKYKAVNGQTYNIVGQRTATGYSQATLSSILQDGWDYAAADEFDDVNIFMEPSGEDSLKSTLSAQRSNIHKLSTYITAIKGSSATVAALEVARSSAPSTRGLAYYANQFLRKENYTSTKFYSNCIGAIGTKLAKIIQDKMGGWAPMYTDHGGLGGQLNVSAESQLIKLSNDDQQLLDNIGLNAIILDSYNGPMIIGQKTAQSPADLSDWSYLGHSMAFDLLKRELRDAVLTPQIGKPNDSTFQNIRQIAAQAVLNKRLGGPNKIWSAGIVDAFSLNDDVTKAARKFKLLVMVKVTTFSEYVDLTLENVGQTTQL